MKSLKVTGGPLTGQSFKLSGMILIGREGDCDIQVLESGASRKHACLLEQDDGTILLRDLASQNGTIIEGQRVTEKVLTEGDSFRIGHSVFVYTEKVQSGFVTEDLDIKVMSGPAVQETTTEQLSVSQMQQLMEAKKAAQFAVKRVVTCCDSPLAARARAEGWPHCPACGSVI